MGLVMGSWASAQPTTAPADAPAGDSPAKGGSNVIREQSIYIPYTKLREVFEKQGRGVFLPYEEFDELWKAAREAQRPPQDPAPPMQHMIQEASHEAEVADEVVRVTATLRIELLEEGWHVVPLGLREAALLEATIDDEPARVRFDAQHGHALLIQKEGDAPEQIKLHLVYARNYTKAPGRNSVSFDTPQTPVSRWMVRIPESGAKIRIEPLIAASEVPEESDDEDASVLKAFVGAAPRVTLHWTPKAEGATGLEALASVKTEQNVRIEEGVMRTQTHVLYTISRATLNRLTIKVTGDHKITNVHDANIRQWTVEQEGEQQLIDVQLFEPASAAQRVTVELERFLPEDPGDVTLPIVEAVGVGRQQGVIVVGMGVGLRAEVATRENVIQVDATDLPEWLKQQKGTFAYRYATLPYSLALSVEQVQPAITTDSLIALQLTPESITAHENVVFNIQKAGVFRLDLTIPESWTISSIQG